MFGHLLAWTAALAMAFLPAQVPEQNESEPLDLILLADKYCIGPDGDHEFTWALAVRDGYTPLSPEDFRNLRAPGARQLRGFTRTIDGVEVRILTAVNRLIGMGQGNNPFHLCWVSAEPFERRSVDSELGAFLGVGRFRQEDAFVYPWIPQPDGSRLTVTKGQFQRRGMAISREDGMRLVLTNHHGGLVAITYMSPVQSCADWCY